MNFKLPVFTIPNILFKSIIAITVKITAIVAISNKLPGKVSQPFILADTTHISSITKKNRLSTCKPL